MSRIEICFATDDRYARHCAAAIASILANAAEADTIRICILFDELSDDSQRRLAALTAIRPCAIDFVRIDPAEFEDCPVPEGGYVRKSNYYRMMIPWLLPDSDRVLYLDCDLIVLGSLSALFEMDLQGAHAAMVVDENEDTHRARLGLSGHYFNSGMIVIDCPRWREADLKARIIDWVPGNIHRIHIADQDILNVVLEDRIMAIDRKWNLFNALFSGRAPDIWEKGRKPVVLHFVGRFKPWNLIAPSEGDKLYFGYLAQTPWAGAKYGVFLTTLPLVVRRTIKRKALRLSKAAARLLGPQAFARIKKIYVRFGGRPI